MSKVAVFVGLDYHKDSVQVCVCWIERGMCWGIGGWSMTSWR